MIWVSVKVVGKTPPSARSVWHSRPRLRGPGVPSHGRLGHTHDLDAHPMISTRSAALENRRRDC